jgi:histidinol phosphatase-like enzyme (inositol monophosphatase family)
MDESFNLPTGVEALLFELARTAGDCAMGYFRQHLDIEDKSHGEHFDPVTQADRDIERRLRQCIHSAFPGHGIVGEEFDDRETGSAYVWYIDPIDGTRSFMTGSPLWGCLVGLVVDDRCVLGALCQPVLGELFWGGPQGSFLESKGRTERLHSATTPVLAEANLYCTHPDMFDTIESSRKFEALSTQCRLIRYGGDCYSYGLLAAGYIDLVVEQGLKPFDIVPLIPILEGAGCIVSDWQGGSAGQGGAIVAAANAELHAEALAYLSD